MKKIFLSASLLFMLGVTGCKKDSEFLDVQPFELLTLEQSFSDPNQVVTIVADFYNRVYDFSAFKYGWESFVGFGDAVPSTFGHGSVQRNGWGFGEWGTWDYGYIRELNLFIQRATAATALSQAEKDRFVAEGRFLRAVYYFEMVKRMGGVPLILEPLLYDNSGDPTNLQYPRSKESEIYDFVISEMEAIKGALPIARGTKDRATRATALAVEARAALYAGSIAKYGASTPSVSTTGGEVGIPASMANAYYTKALAAAEQIIDGSSGPYALYNSFPTNKAQNFAGLFIENADKVGNPETIWIEDYKVRSGKTHGFTIQNQPIFGAEEVEGGRINPSVNLIESFEMLDDNTWAPLPIKDGSGNPIYYDNPMDLFEGRDPRLAGTVVLPGSQGKNRPVDIFAGYQLGNGTVVTGNSLGFLGQLPGVTGDVQLVGRDGPLDAREYAAQSGFYIRKFVDPAIGSGSRGTGSEVPWIRYRYAEVLLNAAEAAFELGEGIKAANYLNQVRTRAGFTTPLTVAEVTFDRIVNERKVELAYEGHVLFDMKRWRLAHIVWDGVTMNEADLVSNIGKANKRSTQPFALWPYKIHNPGQPNHGKWIFKIVKNSIVTGSERFVFGNYYSEISADNLARNPKLVRQPNQ